MTAPAEDDVQVGIGDGELVAHEVLVAVQQVLRDVVELGADLLDLSLLGLALQAVEQRAVRSVDFTGKIVNGVLRQVSFSRAVLASNLARSLCK